MRTLYRMVVGLPTLLLAAASLTACDSEPPPKAPPATASNRYLEALQDAEALKHSVEQRNLDQQRIDELLGREKAQPPTR